MPYSPMRRKSMLRTICLIRCWSNNGTKFSYSIPDFIDLHCAELGKIKDIQPDCQTQSATVQHVSITVGYAGAPLPTRVVVVVLLASLNSFPVILVYTVVSFIFSLLCHFSSLPESKSLAPHHPRRLLQVLLF